MKYKVVTIWFLTFFIVGCELEGDDGVSGAQGQSGPQGERGPQGIVGLSCWDLNEERSEDLREGVHPPFCLERELKNTDMGILLARYLCFDADQLYLLPVFGRG